MAYSVFEYDFGFKQGRIQPSGMGAPFNLSELPPDGELIDGELEASGTITINGIGSIAGEEVTVGDQTYIAVVATPGVNEYIIGVDTDETALNLSNVITATHSLVSAISSTNEVVVTAITPGVEGNEIGLSFASAGDISVSGDALENGNSLKHAFVLGHDNSSMDHYTQPGDAIELFQDMDVTAADIVTSRIRFRQDSLIPVVVQTGFILGSETYQSYSWRFSIRVDDVEQYGETLEAGRQRDHLDLAWYVAPFIGSAKISIKLELVAV